MRLLQYTLYAVLTFAALILAAQSAGHAQPPPDALTRLHLTDCALPCWIGIVPGKTRFDEAVRLVNVTFPQAADATITGQDKSPRYNVDTDFGQILVLADRAGIVHRITLPMYKLHGLVLADVAGLLGEPTGAVGKHPVAFYYGCVDFQALIAGGSVDGGWWQRPILIDIQDVGFSCPGTSR